MLCLMKVVFRSEVRYEHKVWGFNKEGKCHPVSCWTWWKSCWNVTMSLLKSNKFLPESFNPFHWAPTMVFGGSKTARTPQILLKSDTWIKVCSSSPSEQLKPRKSPPDVSLFLCDTGSQFKYLPARQIQPQPGGLRVARRVFTDIIS